MSWASRHKPQTQRSVLRESKNMAVEGGTVSHYYILVIRKFIYLFIFFLFLPYRHILNVYSTKHY